MTQRDRRWPRPLPCTLPGASALALVLLAVAIATPAAAGRTKAALAIERHWTGNALDSEISVPDWYTLLRGSLRHEWGGGDAGLAFGVEFKATRHDVVMIEDDRALALSAEIFSRLPGLELRGTVNYRASSEGDDLPIGLLALGTRTLKQTVGAGAQLGIDLGNATSLILEASNSFERAGPTRFQDDLLPATRLEPNRNRLHFAARLTRTLGTLALGGSASALLASVERLGTPPSALPFRQYGLRGEAAMAGADGSTLGLALGAEWLGDHLGLYSRIRPAWQLAFARPLSGTMELRGTYAGRYETADSDDPLASWLHRAEIEIGFKPARRIALAAGIACQAKENLLFENEERSRGFFAEAVYDASEATALVLRMDASRTFKSVIDVRQTNLDIFVGLRARM